MNLKYPKIIVFDWDNTILEVNQVINEALNETFRHYNKEPINLFESQYKNHKASSELFLEWFGENKAKEAHMLYVKNYAACADKKQLELLEGAEDTIKMASSLPGIICVIISNKDGDILRREVLTLGLSNYFDSIIGAGDAEKNKPDVSTIKLALSGTTIDYKKHHMWVIGDTSSDMELAHNANAHGILLNMSNRTLDIPFKHSLCTSHKDIQNMIEKVKSEMLNT
jgi:phosphoglycolate phosphatase